MMLLPLTLYLIWLGFEIGRRRNPVVFSGTLDGWLLFLGLSGLLFLGPATWVISRFALEGPTTYFLAYAVYAFVVLVVAWRLIRTRRNSLVIYNVDPMEFEKISFSIFDEMGSPYQTFPHQVVFGEQTLVLYFDPSYSLYCMCIHWHGDEALWRKIEGRIREVLKDIVTTRNPAGAILPIYAAILLCFITISVVLFVWYWAFIF